MGSVYFNIYVKVPFWGTCRCNGSNVGTTDHNLPGAFLACHGSLLAVSFFIAARWCCVTFFNGPTGSDEGLANEGRDTLRTLVHSSDVGFGTAAAARSALVPTGFEAPSKNAMAA